MRQFTFHMFHDNSDVFRLFVVEVPLEGRNSEPQVRQISNSFLTFSYHMVHMASFSTSRRKRASC
jgi:hypothetical protein